MKLIDVLSIVSEDTWIQLNIEVCGAKFSTKILKAKDFITDPKFLEQSGGLRLHDREVEKVFVEEGILEIMLK